MARAQETRGATPPLTRLLEMVSHATLPDDLYLLFQNANARLELRRILIEKYLQRPIEFVLRVLAEESGIERYRQQLLEGSTGQPLQVAEAPVEFVLDQPRREERENEQSRERVRSAGFRRAVVEAYDYRCAASGWRIVLPEGAAMTEAAHLIPFSESHDDDPRNGIALTPNYHWALDRNLIAPGPDGKWHVSKKLDRRVRDYDVLRELDGTDLILPKDSRFHPRRDALEWRMEQLRAG